MESHLLFCSVNKSTPCATASAVCCCISRLNAAARGPRVASRSCTAGSHATTNETAITELPAGVLMLRATRRLRVYACGAAHSEYGRGDARGWHRCDHVRTFDLLSRGGRSNQLRSRAVSNSRTASRHAGSGRCRKCSGQATPQGRPSGPGSPTTREHNNVCIAIRSRQPSDTP